ncbi:MAG: hypothetical protein CBE13_002425 [Candidatus Pelagibacter sp. TMED253]|nr:MAG: hypothetical protein CBE13_002425 [Candidatus Pelagibacter sp. TMED253]
MKKIFGLLTALLLLNGCAESVALLGTSVGGASNGKMLQSSLNSAISYGVKKETGKGPLEHAVAYAEKLNPEKKKEPCLSFIKKTNTEICAIVKKQLNLTKSKIINGTRNESLKDLTSSLQPNIDKNSKIEYLD